MDRARTVHDRRHVARMLVGILGVGSLTAAFLAAITLWVLMTDAVVAAEVADRGSLLPVLQHFARTVGQALVTVLKFL